MTLRLPSQSEIKDWREHPVTMAFEAALRAVAHRHREAVTQAYWDGRDVTERERIIVLVRQAMIEDLFELDEEDLRAAMESDDERQRHIADGIQGSGEA